MYKILHASADYLLCSFEFEDMETGEHIFADFFDDPLYDLLSKFKLQYDHELEGKVIDLIPSELRLSTESLAKERSLHSIEGAWLYPWLKCKETNPMSTKKGRKRKENG